VSARTLTGRAALQPSDGPILVTVGVFDGLHLGHVWLLEHLVGEAQLRSARPAVVTFDAHPDAILLGQAPPLLMDPVERLERLTELGVDLVVIEQFDDALRRTTYDAFIDGIARRCQLAGFVMTPDAAFGHERAGTPAAVAELGRRGGFDVVLVPPYTLDRREVRSSEIRTAIATGDLDEAERLLGRRYAVTGDVGPDGRVGFPMPVALPPSGAYAAVVDGQGVRVDVDAGTLTIRGGGPGRTRIELGRRQ
jgi:riboflavin kinase/FMN adenylyltransferase